MFTNEEISILESYKCRLIFGDNLTRKDLERLLLIIGYGSQKSKHLSKYGASDKDESLLYAIKNSSLFK